MCDTEDKQAAVTATAREVAGDRAGADLDRTDIPGQNRERAQRIGTSPAMPSTRRTSSR